MLCRTLAVILAAIWLAGLILVAIGTLGLFGQPRDGLSGVLLVLVGLPWSLLVERLPQKVAPLAMVLAPGITMALLLICGRRR